MRVAVAVSALAALPPAPASAADAGATLLLSRPSGLGALPAASTNSTSANSRRFVSGNGRFIVFASQSDGLSTADNDEFQNVFLRDTQTGTTTLMSRSTGGEAANGDSSAPTISEDGTRVAFSSSASNLDPADTDSQSDIFLHIVGSGSTELVSRRGAFVGGGASDGDSRAPSLSADGHEIAFVSNATNLNDDDANGSVDDVFLRQLDGILGPSTALISRGDGDNGAQDTRVSNSPSVNAAGTKVAFTSAGKLHIDDTNPVGFADVYLRDVAANPDVTLLITRADAGGDPVADNGGVEPSLAGNRVAFSSTATNLNTADTNSREDVHVRDYVANTTTLASRANGVGGDPGDQFSVHASLNGAGDRVLFETASANLADGAPGGFRAVHMRDLGLGTTTLVSRASGASGTPAGGDFAAISADGNHAAFSSEANGLSDADDNDFRQTFVRRVLTVETDLVSRPDGSDPFRSGVNAASLSDAGRATSGDGRYVVFASGSDVLLPGSEDDDAAQVYRRDVVTGDTLLISRAAGADGLPGTGSSSDATISADGSRVAFFSSSPNLASGDTGTGADVFVRDVAAATTVLASRGNGPDGPAADAGGFGTAISGDGRRVAFATQAAGLADGDPDTNLDVLLRDLPSATTTLVSRRDGPDGAKATGSSSPSIDFDGDRVTFETFSALDAAADGNGDGDAYVRDVGANTTRLVSRLNGNGPAANNQAGAADISADGTRIAFLSHASDIAPDDNNGASNAFVHDLNDGSTTLVSRADGPTGAVGNSAVGAPGLSADGTKLAFSSGASNLGVDNPDSRGLTYLRDLATGATQLVSRTDGAGGTPGYGSVARPQVNGNGDCIAFDTTAPGLAADTFAGTDHTQVYMRAVGACPVPNPPGGGGAGAGGGDQPLPPVAAADVLAPTLDRLAMSRKRFRVGSAATPVAAGSRRRRTPAGTRFRWRLSEAATVTLRIERKLAGRRSGRRCVKPTKRNRRARKCTRWSRAGTLTRKAAAGAGGTSFSGRIGRKKLPAGSYQAVVSSKDAAGNASRSRTVAFKIVKR